MACERLSLPLLQDGGEVSWEELKRHAKNSKRKAIRCGKTNNPHKRRGFYSRDPEYESAAGGTMYYFKTKNEKKAENKLLSLRNWEKNVQKTSNAPDEAGYVYVIMS